MTPGIEVLQNDSRSHGARRVRFQKGAFTYSLVGFCALAFLCSAAGGRGERRGARGHGGWELDGGGMAQGRPQRDLECLRQRSADG